MSTPQPTNSVPPYVLENKGTFPAPYELTVPASLEIRPDTATAKFDGTGASGPFLACLTFYGTNGERLARMFNPTPVPQGSVAEVTYIPPFGSAATSAAPGGSGWMFDTDPQAGDWGVLSVTHENPTSYPNGPVPGKYCFRVSCLDEDGANGMLFITEGDAIHPTRYSFLQLAAERATLEAENIVQIQTFNHSPTDIGSTIIQMISIPTSNAGLTNGQLYRAGAGPDSALMIK